MMPRRIARFTVAQIVFAAAVVATSVQLERLIRTRDASRTVQSQPPRIEPAGTPRPASPAPPRDSSSGKPATRVPPIDRSRFVPVGRTKTPIVTAVLAHTGT